MNKYAVVKIGGQQFIVKENQELEINKIEGEKGKKLNFTEVLLLVEDEKVKIGQPLLNNATVQGEILEQFKGEKIRVATYKAKSRYRKVKGFRPLLTRIKITKILA